MKNKTYRIISGALIITLGLCALNLIKAKLPTQQEKEIQQIQEAKSSISLQEKLLENVLKPQYPNAQIVAHRWVKPTLCPAIIPNDETFNTLFN